MKDRRASARGGAIAAVAVVLLTGSGVAQTAGWIEDLGDPERGEAAEMALVAGFDASKAARALAWGKPTAPPDEPAAFLAGCADDLEWVEQKTDGSGNARLHGVGVGPVLLMVLDPTSGVPIVQRIVTVARGQATAVELRMP